MLPNLNKTERKLAAVILLFYSKRWPVLLLLLFILVPHASAQTTEPVDETVRIDADLVDLNVSVFSRDPKIPVGELQQKDFVVLENGEAEEISFFASASAPFDLVLLIDLSLSTLDKMDLIKKSAKRFVEAARPADRISIVTFTSTVQVVSPLTSDRAALFDRIKRMEKPRGGTNFWNVASGQELITIKGHESTVDSLALSPDGKLLASGSHDQTIKLWNVSTGALVRTFRLPSAWIFLIAFSPDGRQLASLSEEKTLNLWEVDTGRELATPPKAPEWMKVPFVARVNNQAIRAYSLDAEIRLVDISNKL